MIDPVFHLESIFVRYDNMKYIWIFIFFLMSTMSCFADVQIGGDIADAEGNAMGTFDCLLLDNAKTLCTGDIAAPSQETIIITVHLGQGIGGNQNIVIEAILTESDGEPLNGREVELYVSDFDGMKGTFSTMYTITENEPESGMNGMEPAVWASGSFTIQGLNFTAVDVEDESSDSRGTGSMQMEMSEAEESPISDPEEITGRGSGPRLDFTGDARERQKLQIELGHLWIDGDITYLEYREANENLMEAWRNQKASF